MFAATKPLMTFSKLNHLKNKGGYDRERQSNGLRNLGALDYEIRTMMFGLALN